MTIGFILDDDERMVTPLKTAEAIIESEEFDYKELKELIAYLSVYTKYNV